jgi:AcrR family transcriptional regulator
VPRAKLRTEELRAHVLQVALRILEHEGVQSFTARRVASEADTSLPAVYELFGDKAGLIRELFFEGFRSLRTRFDGLAESTDPRANLLATMHAFREFTHETPVLAHVMFSEPFASFHPGPSELKAGNAVRRFLLARVRSCLDAGVLAGDESDIAHVLIALVQGLSAQERAGWLGSSSASVERRWRLATEATLRGLSPLENDGSRRIR